jgi:hypothetical protein
MKTTLRSRFRASAFSFVEISIYSALASAIGLVTYSFVRSGTILSAKNVNLTLSHSDLRNSFDRLADHLLSANNIVTLIGTDGLPSTAVAGPAAGVKYDRVVGEPYVLDSYASAGSIPASATSVSMWRVWDDLTAPVPNVGDVLLLPTESGMIRALISSVPTPPAAVGGKQKVTVNLSTSIGKIVSWQANQWPSAKVVRPEAFIVIPNNGANELRYYSQFQPLPALNDPTTYRLLTDQISTQTNEDKPFTILDQNGDKILQSTLRVRERRDARWIANDEMFNYNTYFQLLINLPSRNHPKTTN